MARIVGVFQTAHTPFCYRSAEDWSRVRSARPVRADVPLDDLEENKRKHARVQKSFAVLREKLAQARADVIIIFGDDQLECFDFRNYPAFSVYVGEEFEGYLPGICWASRATPRHPGPSRRWAGFPQGNPAKRCA